MGDAFPRGRLGRESIWTMPDLGGKPPKPYPSLTGYTSHPNPLPQTLIPTVYGVIPKVGRQLPGERQVCNSKGFGFPVQFPREGLQNHSRERQTLGINLGKKLGMITKVSPRSDSKQEGTVGIRKGALPTEIVQPYVVIPGTSRPQVLGIEQCP